LPAGKGTDHIHLIITDNQEDVGSYRNATGKGNVGVEERMAIDSGDDSVTITAGGLADNLQEISGQCNQISQWPRWG
jgi:hypothetical protein